MQEPLHPIIVHFPIALTVILPVLILVFAFMMKLNKLSRQTWLIIIGLQLATTVTGYIALETGETDEDVVEKVVDRKFIHEHEEAAEIFVGATVVALVLSIGSFFLKTQILFTVQLVIGFVSLICCYLAYNTGILGGELVYKHGAASAYVIGAEFDSSEGLLPTQINSSESPSPVDENESLKADDNDYGTSDEADDIEDEDSKQED